MPFIRGTVKNYHARNLQVITVFNDGFSTGCYCVYKTKRVHGEYLVTGCTSICHLHKQKERVRDQKDYDLSESSIRRSRSKILDYALADYFDYFITLTFDPKKVNSLDHENTKKLLSKWLNNFRRKCPDLKYIIVPELHKSGAIHFHGLVKGINAETVGLIESRTKLGRLRKDRGGRQVYNLNAYGYGFSTVVPLDDNPATAYYITKYIKKSFSQNAVLNKKRYWVSRSLLKSFAYTVSEESDISELEVNSLGLISVYKGKYYTKYTRSTVLDYTMYNTVAKEKKPKRKRLIESQSDSHVSLVR